MTNPTDSHSRRGTAFITGASSGIGAAFARRLAADGYRLVLHGRRENLLADLCADIRRTHGSEAEYLLGELSRPDDVLALEERIRRIPDLTLLVNNAGSSTIRYFHEEALEGQDAMIRVHVLAPVRFTHAALPGMIARREGAIINVSSVASFVVAPGSATYCAVKAFLTSFSESLALEMEGTGVRVQALCPGFTVSDFHERLGYRVDEEFFRGFMSAEKVVEISLKDLARGNVVSIPGFRYKAVAVLRRMVPRKVLYWSAGIFSNRRERKLAKYA